MKDINKKIFDDFTKVDCSDCSHYWDDSCEGVKKGSEKRCTAFKAVKRIDIPVQVERLRRAGKGLGWAVTGLGVAMLIHIVSGWF